MVHKTIHKVGIGQSTRRTKRENFYDDEWVTSQVLPKLQRTKIYKVDNTPSEIPVLYFILYL